LSPLPVIPGGESDSELADAETLVLSRLTQAEIDEIQGMMADGITAEEKEKIKQIVYSKFSQEEIEKFKEFLTAQRILLNYLLKPKKTQITGMN
jgi:hypothetical protein